MNILFFYANKGFHSRINFNLDFIDYNIIRKRFDIVRVEDITIRI